MANPEHLAVLERGVYAWNQWREENPRVLPDLRTAYLREANLDRYNLRAADLRGAVLLAASMRNADASGANFTRADVRFLETTGAQLRGACFRDARGVTRLMRRAAWIPPSRRVVLTGVVAALALCGLGVLLYLQYAPARQPGAEKALAEAEETSAPQRSPAEREKGAKPIDPNAFESELAGLQMPGFRLENTELSDRVLTLQVDAPTVTEEIYLPAVAAACGAVASAPNADRIDAIHVVASSGESGWAFENAQGCALLVSAPPALVRLAVQADSRPLDPSTLEKD